MSAKKAAFHDVQLIEAAPATTWLRGQTMQGLRGTLLPEYFGAIEAPT